MAANEISQLFIEKFASDVIHLAQQKKSKLRSTVTVKSDVANQFSFRTVAARGAMTAKTGSGTVAGKRSSTVFVDTVTNNRIVVPTPKYTTDSFEWDDLARMIVQPSSYIMNAMASQLGRTFDDVIIASAFAAALDELGGSTNHPAGMQLGGATTAPSFDLVRLAAETLDEKDIDPDEEKFFVVSPNFVHALLSDPKVSSSDYTTGQALMNAKIVSGWYGFTWIMSNRLASPGGAGPYQRYGIAYTRDGIGLGVNTEGKVEVAKAPTLNFATVIQLQADFGAVRIQDEKVLRIHYLETN